jgi:hypothetical protein
MAAGAGPGGAVTAATVAANAGSPAGGGGAGGAESSAARRRWIVQKERPATRSSAPPISHTRRADRGRDITGDRLATERASLTSTLPSTGHDGAEQRGGDRKARHQQNAVELDATLVRFIRVDAADEVLVDLRTSMD